MSRKEMKTCPVCWNEHRANRECDECARREQLEKERSSWEYQSLMSCETIGEIKNWLSINVLKVEPE